MINLPRWILTPPRPDASASAAETSVALQRPARMSSRRWAGFLGAAGIGAWVAAGLATGLAV